MIDLSNTALYNQYICTPITWLHNIKIQYKLSLTFLLLAIIPYQKYLHIIFSIFVLTSIFLSLKIQKNYYLWLINLLYITVFYLFLGKVNRAEVLITNQTIFNIHLRLFNKHSTLRFILPEFLIRISTIIILHMISIQLILWTTMYENILMFILNIAKLSNRKPVRVIVISSFAYQFLEQITICMKTIEVSMKLRNNKSIITSGNIYMIKFILGNYISYLKKQINRISSILHVRQVQAANFITPIF